MAEHGGDVRVAVRRGRPKAAPDRCFVEIACIGKRRSRFGTQCGDASRIDIGATAGDVGHAGDPQPVAEARIHNLAFEVGDADVRRVAVWVDLSGQAITLQRIKRDSYA